MRGNEPENKKMRKTIVAIILGIALISLASAIYAGDCLEVDLSELESLDNVVYDVVGNSSNLTGMNITLNEITRNVSICFVVNYKPDSFTLIFIDNSTNTIIKEVPGTCPSCSGGGTRYKDRNITVEKIVYVNQTEETEEPIELEGEKKVIWPYFFWGFFILAIIAMWIRVLKKQKKRNDEKDTQK